MTDVFISYAREDREHAQRLAEILAKKGHKVWWDWNLVGGTDFRSAIQSALNASRKVIVIWSSNSVASSFVIDEAGQAHRQGKLVPIRIDNSTVPLGFGNLHVIETDRFDQDVELIDAALRDQTPSPEAAVSAVARRRWRTRRTTASGIAVALLLGGLAVALYSLMRAEGTTADYVAVLHEVAADGQPLPYSMTWSVNGEQVATMNGKLTQQGDKLFTRDAMRFTGRNDDVEFTLDRAGRGTIILHTWADSKFNVDDLKIVRSSEGYRLTGSTFESAVVKKTSIDMTIAAR